MLAFQALPEAVTSPGDEIRKNARQNQVAPAIPGAEAKDAGGFLEIRGNGHGAGDDVEKDVPLRAEQHHEHGGKLEATAEAKQNKKDDGKQRGGGNGSGDLRERLRDARETRTEADGDAGGTAPEGADEERGVDAKKRETSAAQECEVVLAAQDRTIRGRVKYGEAQTDENHGRKNDEQAERRVPWRFGTENASSSTARADGKLDGDPVDDRAHGKTIEANDKRCAPDETEQVVRGGLRAFDLLEFEFIRPGDDRPPDQLIEKNDDGDHGGESPKNRARIAVARGGLQKRAEAWQAEIAIAENKHFAGHQEEPAAGDGHHRVPDEADGGVRQIQLDESLPAAEAVNNGRFS